MQTFQESNFLIKLWRYRWYLLIPFKYTYHTYFKPLQIFDYTHFQEKEEVKLISVYGLDLMKLLEGEAQIKMNWVVSQEEMMNKLEQLKEKYKQNG